MAGERKVARAVLRNHGQTFAEEIGVRVERGTPAVLFGLLCASLLMSARISHEISIVAARGVVRRWSTARKLDGSTWEQRVRVLNEAGYTRDEAERDPRAERRALKQFKGVGDVGADIFLREVQVTWDEVFPFADERARRAAGRLGLPRDADALAKLVSRAELPRLVAGLVRVGLNDDFAAIRDAA